MEKTENGLLRFLYHCPPLLVILSNTALCFVIGYLAGWGAALVPGSTVRAEEWAGLFALIPGFCGSILFLMQKE